MDIYSIRTWGIPCGLFCIHCLVGVEGLRPLKRLFFVLFSLAYELCLLLFFVPWHFIAYTQRRLTHTHTDTGAHSIQIFWANLILCFVWFSHIIWKFYCGNWTRLSVALESQGEDGGWEAAWSPLVVVVLVVLVVKLKHPQYFDIYA